MIDELLTRQLLRQLRILNTFLIAFAISLLILVTVVGIFMYKAVQEVRDTKKSLDTLQAKVQGNLDLKSDICDSKGSVSKLLESQTNICE